MLTLEDSPPGSPPYPPKGRCQSGENQAISNRERREHVNEQQQKEKPPRRLNPARDATSGQWERIASYARWRATKAQMVIRQDPPRLVQLE